jgi:hypothetical protein
MASDSHAWADLEGSLETIARWNMLRGRPELAVVAAPDPHAPERIKEAWVRITRIAGSALLGTMPPRSASDEFDRELKRLDRRAIDILRDRVFADAPMTLDELGAQFGLTRERVRQLEKRAISGLQTSEQLADLRALASCALGPDRLVVPLNTMLGESPALTETVSRVGQPLWRVLDRIDGSFEVKDGWWCRTSVKNATSQTRSALRAAAADLRSIRVDDVPMLKDSSWAVEWVNYCGVRTHEGYALLASSGIPDRAAVTLECEGAPMSVEDLASRIGSARAVGSVRNALGSDERFARVDRNSWALKSWGLGTYQSIRQLIADEVSVNGGSVRLSKLVAGITERFSVSATSVMGYASAPPFVTVDGFVELASVQRAAPRKSPFDTRRLFRLDDGWALRLTISLDHARGSGSPLPSALIAVLALSYGEAKYLPCRMGDQRVGWSGPQLTLGSIKRIVDGERLTVGDTCFAVFGDDGSFDIQRVSITADSGQQRAFELAGLTLRKRSAGRDDLARAVGLVPGSSTNQISEKLRARGDYEVADCMLVGPSR